MPKNNKKTNNKLMVEGIKCRACGYVLPPHTQEQHLNIVFVKTLHSREECSRINKEKIETI